jgi:hypothetical protein
VPALTRSQGSIVNNVSLAAIAPKPPADVVARFVDAFQHGDPNAAVALLTDDAKVTMPRALRVPQPRRDRSLLPHPGLLGTTDRAGVPTTANHQPAFGYYLPDPHTDIHRAAGLLVLTVIADHTNARKPPR